MTPFYVFGAKQSSHPNEMQPQINISTDKTILKFYPEGGTIISGLSSTIALSAMDENGRPKIISGVVKNDHDSTVATFSTNNYGLGKFSYFPNWFNKCTVFIKNEGRYDSIASLTPTNFYAVQLAVTQQNNDYITARVALEDSIYSKNYTTYLIAVSGDSLCFTGVGRGMYNVVIPVAKFPPGVATLYLFNDKNELLNTLKIYVKKANYHLTIESDKQNYSARKKIKLHIKITDTNNLPEVASLSLSVADKNVLDTTLNFFQTDTLQNLSSEDADLIMLTQNEKLNPLYPTITPANNNDNYSGFILSGTIVNTKSQPVSNCIITILCKQAVPIVETDTSNENGRFKLNLPPYADSTQFVFQLSDLKGKNQSNYHIIFDADSAIRFSTPSYLKTTFPLSTSLQPIKIQLAISDSAFEFEGKHWLKPVIVKSYKNKEVNYDESKRVSHFSRIITSDMIGYGPGKAGFALENIPLISFPALDDPLLVVDGMEMDRKMLQGLASREPGSRSPALSYINSIPVETIDFIEVLYGGDAAAYGMEGGHGVILINTKPGGDISTPGEALKNFYTKGFYVDKSFEMPDYSNPQIQKLKSPDYRKTIYWNGNIVTDKNGEASVEFFAADQATTYIGIIRGITVNGDKIYQTFTISRN